MFETLGQHYLGGSETRGFPQKVGINTGWMFPQEMFFPGFVKGEKFWGHYI